MDQGSGDPPSAIDSLGKGTAILVIGTLALFLLTFLGRVAVARHLSLTDFGDFSLGISLAGLLSLVALLGLHQAVARTLAARTEPDVRLRLVRWSAWVTTAAAVVSSVAVYLFAGQIARLFNSAQTGELTVVFQFFSLTVGFSLLCTYVASIFQGFEDTFPYAILNQGVQPAVFLAGVLALLYGHLSLVDVLAAWLASYFVTFAALLIYAWRKLPGHLPRVTPARELPAGLWILSLSLWGVATLVFLTGYVDTLILGVFRPEAQVGTYSAVLNLARLILIAANAVTFIFLPVAARLTASKNASREIQSSYLTSGRWVLIFTVPMFLVFAFLPSDSLTAIFGPAYAAGGGSLALTVVAVAALISVACGPVSGALAGMALTRPLLVSAGVAAITNIVLSFLLIPSYGLMGAAIAWSVARVAYPATGLAGLYLSADIGPFHRSFLLPFGVSLAAGIPLFILVGLIPHPAWVIFPMYAFGVVLFLSAVLATRTVREDDLVIVRLFERLVGRPLPGATRFLERFQASSGSP